MNLDNFRKKLIFWTKKYCFAAVCLSPPFTILVVIKKKQSVQGFFMVLKIQVCKSDIDMKLGVKIVDRRLFQRTDFFSQDGYQTAV